MLTQMTSYPSKLFIATPAWVADRKFPARVSCVKFTCALLQDINEMVHTERPDWQSVMTYVTAIYKYFET